MEPTIYKPGIYKGAGGIYKGAGGIYKGRGVYNDGVGGSYPEELILFVNGERVVVGLEPNEGNYKNFASIARYETLPNGKKIAFIRNLDMGFSYSWGDATINGIRWTQQEFLDKIKSLNEFTFEFYLRRNNTSYYDYPGGFTWLQSGAQGFYLMPVLHYNESVGNYIEGTVTENASYKGTSNYLDWTHLTIVRKGKEIFLYSNGKLHKYTNSSVMENFSKVTGFSIMTGFSQNQARLDITGVKIFANAQYNGDFTPPELPYL